jgi:hypothetical protein
MALKNHQINLSLLREGEEVMHNCTSHWLVHLRLPLLYLISLLIPFLAVFALISSQTVDDPIIVDSFWMIYSWFGLIITTYFFVRAINFELGGCVITNQRILRFGYKGLSEMVEREILPKKIEDVKIVKKGILSFLFDAADVLIHTSNNEVERLKNVMESRKIQKIFSDIFSQQGSEAQVMEGKSDVDQSETWIDDALGQSEGQTFDENAHRDDMIDQIGDVFRAPGDSSP